MTLLQYEHKKAIFHMGEAVITDCLSTCPACAAIAQLAKVVGEIEGLGVPIKLDEAEMRDFGYSVVRWLEAAKKEI